MATDNVSDLRIIYANPAKRQEQLEFSRQRYAEFTALAKAADDHWAATWRELAALHQDVIDQLEKMECDSDETTNTEN